jgi:hypothetical protein
MVGVAHDNGTQQFAFSETRPTLDGKPHGLFYQPRAPSGNVNIYFSVYIIKTTRPLRTRS